MISSREYPNIWQNASLTSSLRAEQRWQAQLRWCSIWLVQLRLCLFYFPFLVLWPQSMTQVFNLSLPAIYPHGNGILLFSCQGICLACNCKSLSESSNVLLNSLRCFSFIWILVEKVRLRSEYDSVPGRHCSPRGWSGNDCSVIWRPATCRFLSTLLPWSCLPYIVRQYL